MNIKPKVENIKICKKWTELYTNRSKMQKIRGNIIYAFNLNIAFTATIFMKLTNAQVCYGEISLPTFTQIGQEIVKVPV
jgi:predicted hydrocarbon binding protein